MAKITWTVLAGASATDISSKVLSINMTFGRQKYLDTYSGNSVQVTINNAGDFASTLAFNAPIYISGNIGSGPGTDIGIYQRWYIQEVNFNDYPGNTGLNTATITAVDFMSRAGRINISNFAFAQVTTAEQAITLTNILPADMAVTALYPLQGSIASASTYTGTVANYLNYLQTTERGILVQNNFSCVFVTRSQLSNFSVGSYTLGRTTSSTQVAYQDIKRIQNGIQFINNATVASSGLTSQTATNASSITTYGSTFYSSTSVDATETQALGNAQWIANTFSNPTSLRYETNVNDWTQNGTALLGWLRQLFLQVGSTVNPFYMSKLYYQPPGGSSTAVDVVLEGFNVNVLPDGAVFNMSWSPLQYYQFFTLDSATLGILDTSRLGW